jgi:hypothetical protein
MWGFLADDGRQKDLDMAYRLGYTTNHIVFFIFLLLRNEGTANGRADKTRQCVYQEETDHIYRCVSLHRSSPPSSFSRYILP